MIQNPQKEFFPNASKNGKDIEEISSLPDQPVRPNSYSLMELDTLNTKSQKLEYEVSREAKGKGDTPELKTHYRDLTIKAEEKIYFDETLVKVHSWVLIEHHRTGKNKIELSLQKYKELTGLVDDKTARMQLARAIHNLVGLKISRTNFKALNHNQKRYEPFVDDVVLYVSGKYGQPAYKRGKGYLTISDDFAKALDDHTTPKIYPKILFKLKGTSFYLLNALIDNKQINYNKKNGRGDRMPIGSILKLCPNLPSWEKVKEGNRSYGSRIIKPLDNAIKELSDQITCSFIDTDGRPQKSITNLPLDGFLDCKIVVTDWKNINVDQVGRSKQKGQKKKQKIK